jgi:hypothetical protein
MIVMIICSIQIAPVKCLASGQERSSRNRSVSAESGQEQSNIEARNRRSFLKTSLTTIVSSLPFIVAKEPSLARYILNDNGDYEEIEDEAWQTVWKQRLDKASTMSKDEIFNAARGAGNMNLKDGEESEASRKRRAMSNCRNKDIRNSVGFKDEKQCAARVMSGDFDFILSSGAAKE